MAAHTMYDSNQKTESISTVSCRVERHLMAGTHLEWSHISRRKLQCCGAAEFFAFPANDTGLRVHHIIIIGSLILIRARIYFSVPRKGLWLSDWSAVPRLPRSAAPPSHRVPAVVPW